MKPSKLLMATLAAAGLSVQAKTVDIHVNVDANQVFNAWSPAWYTGPSFALSAGDTLTVEFDFLPGQALQVSKPVAIGMQASAVDPTTSFDTLQYNSLSFVGLQGPAINPPGEDNHTSGYGVMNFFYPNQFLTTPNATISFTGLKFGTTITSYSDAAVDRQFNYLYMFVSGDDIHAVTAVPEPASFGLLALGLGVVGLRARKKAA